MKYKGFTLVELLAVIAILGILALLLVPNIVKIRKDYLNKTYQTRIRLIHNAALDWASDNLVNVPSDVSKKEVCNCINYENTLSCHSCNNIYECTSCSNMQVVDACNQCTATDGNCCSCITIGELINKGYLSGSDNNKTVMTNPINNENLNNKNVCVRYDSNNIFNRKLITFIEE